MSTTIDDILESSPAKPKPKRVPRRPGGGHREGKNVNDRPRKAHVSKLRETDIDHYIAEAEKIMGGAEDEVGKRGYGYVVRGLRAKALGGSALALEVMIAMMLAPRTNDNARIRAAVAMTDLSMGKVGSVKLPDRRFCELVLEAVGAELKPWDGKVLDAKAVYDTIQTRMASLIQDIATPEQVRSDP